jgi:hypothetical protein
MMERLEERGRAIGARASADAAERLAEAARGALPGLSVTVSGETVTMEGRGIGRRWLADPAFRWIGGWLK